MDMHLHCGLERQIDLNAWLDMAMKDGRRAIVMLDHLELYRKTDTEYAAWLKEKGFKGWYPMGAPGHVAMFAAFDQAIAERKDLVLFKGWEIYEGELDTGVEEAPMRMVDVIGWHISPNNGKAAPNGATLIKRATQIKEIQKRFPIPMILFHPFTMRIENLQRTAVREGREVKSLTAADYRFFQPGEQEQLIAILKGTSIYIEMARESVNFWNDPIVREAMIADIKPLVDAGVQFTVSTDNHYVPHAQISFHPERFCADVGLTPANTNTLIREMLAQRAKREATAMK